MRSPARDRNASGRRGMQTNCPPNPPMKHAQAIVFPARRHNLNRRVRSSSVETLKTLALVTMAVLALAGIIVADNYNPPAPDMSKAPACVRELLLIK